MAACSLPLVDGGVASSDPMAPARPSPGERRESSCEEPMDVEPSASSPCGKESDQAERSVAPPEPTRQGVTATSSSNTTGAAPLEQNPVERSAGVSGCTAMVSRNS